MPLRGNYHSQRYKYASSASILINKSDKTSPHLLNIVSGKINGTDCTVLRDTGCTCVGIRQSLLKPNDVTNETATCQMFDGSEKKFRKATAFIETPFFTGKVTALALANPVVDVIRGMSEKKQEKRHNSKSFDQINLKLTQIEVHFSTTSQRNPRGDRCIFASKASLQ
ncbi:hypothetical protein PoB_001488600 [Plakobranchus ocellatus]|uniref:Uncharacterized protein n=1 Tax=Plakobranchus ocellatus TaxID=259542 RepID=A0AAV3YXW0_9GAST|nr:hypothetical protein PoB_001488600 [Plakobranchus ocellatus]